MAIWHNELPANVVADDDPRWWPSEVHAPQAVITSAFGDIEYGTCHKTCSDGKKIFYPIVDGIRFADEFSVQADAMMKAHRLADEFLRWQWRR